MITKSWFSRCWQLGRAGLLALVGVIAVGVGDSLRDSFASRATAQIAPDTTLGDESSVVTPVAPDFPVDVIAGGATRGVNLFHSFLEFNANEGLGAYFNNPAGIENILSRVTVASL